MKTLINKANPQIRITAPEIKEKLSFGELVYEIKDKEDCCLLFDETDWTLVEYHEVSVSDANSVSNTQEEPEVDLEKEIERFLNSEESTSHTNASGFVVAFKDTVKIARHFYELGKKRGSK